MILVFEGGCQDEIRIETSVPCGCFPVTKSSSAAKDEGEALGLLETKTH